MSICPNINLQEWKDLEAGVGTLEAFRDFMETGGEIRTTEQVQAKLAERTGYPDRSIPESNIIVPVEDDHSGLKIVVQAFEPRQRLMDIVKERG